MNIQEDLQLNQRKNNYLIKKKIKNLIMKNILYKKRNIQYVCQKKGNDIKMLKKVKNKYSKI